MSAARENATPLTSTTNMEADPSSPFYLHHSDGPGTTLVTQLMTGNNYPTWSRAITMAFEAKNKLGFVDGTIPEPSATSARYTIWKHCNSTVLSWLLNAVTKEIANSVVFMKTARAIWLDLNERYSQHNAPRVFKIQRSIVNHMQRNDSVTTYHTTLKSLWDELSIYNTYPTCTCGTMSEIIQLEEQGRLMQFLMGLNESYSNLRSQILIMSPLPTVTKALSLVLQDERQRSIQVLSQPPYPEQSTMAASNVQRSYSGYRQSQSFKNKGTRPFYHCDFCGMDGHSESRCRKKPGNSNFPQRRETREFHSQQSRLQNRPMAATVDHEALRSDCDQPFTQEQIQQLLSLIQPNITNSSNSNPLVNMAGPVNEEGDWFGEGA
ncbi:hypothetical protein SLEP1_g41125 [Rubroshorea leprosula]|uniref:Retrotransposon Copia-like N-terminal domain-containing protein n=1 Tax=Rubroshorea leprosula TaxID=152421 RepID=A0AAV5L5L9_9ROSI|nr:hypothetical protein SLEP1_g41125 [Rubroshorea leprosula]